MRSLASRYASCWAYAVLCCAVSRCFIPADILAAMVAYKERGLQGLNAKRVGFVLLPRTISYNRLFSRYSIMKSTIIAVAMTLIFSVFSVSARPQDPFTSTIDSSIISTATPSDSVTDSTTLNPDSTSISSSSSIPISSSTSIPVSSVLITTDTSTGTSTSSTTPTTTSEVTSSTSTEISTSTAASATLAAPSSGAAAPMAMRADGIAAGIFAGIMAVIVL